MFVLGSGKYILAKLWHPVLLAPNQNMNVFCLVLWVAYEEKSPSCTFGVNIDCVAVLLLMQGGGCIGV